MHAEKSTDKNGDAAERVRTEIKLIVGRVQGVQEERRLSDAQLLREYPDLGSTRTWRNRLVSGVFGDLNQERTLARLRRVACILDGGSPDEAFFPKMPFAVEMLARLNRLERQTNDRRILVCLAPNGVGKSAFARWAVGQSRATRVYVRIRPTWRNKAAHILTGILKALGKEPSTTNVAKLEDAAVQELKGDPKSVFLDQAHEGDLALMNELRVFIDETSSRFVYLAYPTAYNRVHTGTTDALIEAQAFIGRCLKPAFDLYRNGIAAADVVFYLQEVGGLSKSAAESVGVRVLPVLQAKTNLRLLDDAIEAAGRADENGVVAPDQVVEQVEYLAGVPNKELKRSEGRDE